MSELDLLLVRRARRIVGLEDRLATLDRSLHESWASEKRLAAKIAQLEAALRTAPCPKPMSPASDGFGYLTTADCQARGECGCDQGAALQSETNCDPPFANRDPRGGE